MKKRVLSLFLALALLCALLPQISVRASADTVGGACGPDLNWSLDPDTGALSITGTGPMYDYYQEPIYWEGSGIFAGYADPAPWGAEIYDPETEETYYTGYVVRSVTISGGAASIGAGAFFECDELVSVSIPGSVTSIGKEAFRDCTGLSGITIPSGVSVISDSAFSGCSGLASVTIPDSVGSVGDYAFQACTSLTRVSIGSGASSVSPVAFAECPNLTSLAVSSQNPYLCTDSSGVLYNKDQTKLIRCLQSFRGALTIPGTVTEIGPFAFLDCDRLTGVSIPDSVAVLGDFAFCCCSSLTGIALPASLAEIGNNAFSGCTDLSDFQIPDSVVSIGIRAFDNIARAGSWENGMMYYDNWLIGTDSSISGSVTIPEGTRGIAGLAFSGRGQIAAVAIPGSVRKIGDGAFQNCENLSAVTIAEGVAAIGTEAFYNTFVNYWYNCDEDASEPGVFIPESVTSIGEYAFGYFYFSFTEGHPFNWYDDPYRKIGDFTIIGFSGSAAETYANDNGLSFTALAKPSITGQPQSVTVEQGKTATFEVIASGTEPLNYQWQYKKVGESGWTDWAGKTAATVSCTAGVSNNGCQYRCVVSNEYGSVTSDIAVLTTLLSGPVITAHPKSVSVVKGKTATFSVTATGTGLSYQWQYKKVGESGWTNWAGKTAATVSCTAGTSNNGCQYRCVVKNSSGSTTSNVAVLTTILAPSIIAQPRNTAVAKGKTATFTVTASGGGLSYQWQYKKVGQSSWTNWSGKTAATVTCTAGTSNNGCQYRCVVKNAAGSVTSDVATLTTVINAPAITSQPKNTAVARGERATFKITASGEGLSYQWQYRKVGETGWTNWSGKTSATVSCTAGTANDGCLYRCVVKNALGSVTSATATLTTVLNAPAITSQPKNTSVNQGGTATFKVVATGEALSYQWQYKKAGQSSWTNWSGKTSATVSCTAGTSNNGCLYRCVIKNALGSVTSNTAKLTTVIGAPVITAQPKSVGVAKGETATFQVTATGSGLSYQWQYKKVGESAWTNWSGKTAAKVTCTAGTSNNGCQYRCVVKNSKGSVTSSVAVLTTVLNAPVITSQPKNTSVRQGGTATFKVVATGEALSYQWQYKKVGQSSWTNWSGKTSATVTCTAGTSNNGCLYRCVIKNALGTVTSGTAKLTTVIP